MADSTPAITRRRFVTYFSSVGLSSTLLPGVLWARLQEERAERITAAMLKDTDHGLQTQSRNTPQKR